MQKIHFDTIDSTNTWLKDLVVKEGRQLPEPVLVTADEQTAGRGRTGKSFSSLRGNGLYMSVAFQVDRMPQDCLFMTVAAAVAVCRILREYGCPDAGIKWVNDIYQQDRKVCGILTEAVTDPDTGIMRCVVVGIGININADFSGLPEDLQKKVGTLRNLNVTNEILAERIAEELLRLITEALRSAETKKEVLALYRNWSMIIGREISWEDNGETKTGIAVDIDDNANLIVRTAGKEEKLDSGYISILFH